MLQHHFHLMRTAPLGLCAALALASFVRAEADPNGISAELRNKAISVLREVMKESKSFEAVHAAEALIWSGHPEGIKEFFVDQDQPPSSELPYRIGIWRTLYRLNANSAAGQRLYLEKILAVLADPKAEDQIVAAETLGKLKYAGAGNNELFLDLAKHGKHEMPVLVEWILSNSGKEDDEARLAERLRGNTLVDRENAAYAFRHFASIRPATLKAIEDLATIEPVEGEVRCYALGALYTHLPPSQSDPAKRELLEYVQTGNTDQRYQACMALANRPTEDMVPIVEKLLTNKAADERVGAAYVLLKIGQPRDQTNPNH